MKAIRVLTVALCIFASAIVLMGASGGCGSSLHKATLSAGAIAASLHTAATANHDNILETDDERKQIANYIVQTAAANDEFIGVLTKAQSGGAADVATITAAFGNLVDRVDQLESQGVLRIKNPDAQARFALIVTSIKAELSVIQALYPPPTAQSGPDTPAAPGRRHSYPPIMALTLTATEIEELIALVIAAGSALAPKLIALRGKPDAQILSEASADDAAAIAIAESDGADPPK